MNPAEREILLRTAPAPAAAALAAEECYRRGAARHEAGDPQAAADWYEKGLALDPAEVRLHFSLGRAFQDMGQVDAAAASYRKAIDFGPDCAPAYFNLGVLLLSNDRFAEALQALRRATELEPGFAEAYNNLGVALQGLGSLPEAADSFREAIRLKPDYLEAQCNAGRAFFAMEHWREAMAFFRNALALQPGFVPALHDLGLCLHKQRTLDQAEKCYREVLKRQPHHLQAHIDLGNICLDRGDLDGMAAWYRQALAYAPRKTEHLLNISRILQRRERWEESLACIEEALTYDPQHAEARSDRALVLLRTGRLAEGWPEYEWRFQRTDWEKFYPYRLPGSRWNGAPFAGKTLLVHCEQGFGDTLQFARYLPLVKQRGGTVIFESQAALCSLLQAFPGVDELVALSADAPISRPYDLHVPLLSLPGLFAATLETIPADTPYLFAETAAADAWKRRLGPAGLRVGIVWAGSAWHVQDSSRSCGLAPFLRLAEIPGVQLIGLQKGPAARAAAEVPRHLPLVNYGAELNDFADTAALVSTLDLVISVDTAVVHLAGAMGKPVWVLLPPVADWRWLLGRNDSPWYPTLRLFRKGRDEPWPDVFERVVSDLNRIAADPRSGSSRDRGC